MCFLALKDNPSSTDSWPTFAVSVNSWEMVELIWNNKATEDALFWSVLQPEKNNFIGLHQIVRISQPLMVGPLLDFVGQCYGKADSNYFWLTWDYSISPTILSYWETI